MRKPPTADGYEPGLAVAARKMCLYIATILGDLLNDVVVVGGLVPYLLVDQRVAVEAHVGTRDLDLGLALALLDHERYREMSARLRGRDFKPDQKEGNITRQTWCLPEQLVTIDFLIPKSPRGPEPGKLQSLEADFAAVVTPALPVAFVNKVAILIDDETPAGELAKRTVNVCGPAAFVVMKAHALRLRGENKDAYDLVYILKNFGDGTVREVAEQYQVIKESPEAQESLDLLADDFASASHVGAVRAARFKTGRADPAAQADAHGYVQEFLRLVKTV
jgi:hypothetical protein